MENTIKELKRINKRIATFKSELENIHQWNEDTPGDRSVKKEGIEKHTHFIGELKESRVLILRRLKNEIQNELINETEVEYEHPAISA